MACNKQPYGKFTAVGSEISYVDSQAMIELAAKAGDGLAGAPLIRCKRNVFDGISRLVDASSWIWLIGQIDITNQDSFAILTTLTAGCLDDRERDEVLAANDSSEFQATFRSFIREGIETRTGFTRLRSEMIEDTTWYESACGKRWLALGFDRFIMSFFPLDQTTFSVICFHRRPGEERFSQREQTIVDVIFHGINWLHRVDKCDAELNDLACLTPRERQVLALILKGVARKGVASALEISQHTVADHLKEIYRKLEVNSRAELLAKFIPGAQASPTVINPDDLF